MEEYEGDFYISKSALELLAEEAEKQDFLKTTGKILDGYIALLNQGISPEAAKGIYMTLMEDSFE